jgi:translocation and assembly module TamB
VDTPGIWVKDTKLLVLLAGQIKAAKLPGQPLAVAGDLQAVKGAIELHGRSFKVAEGNLHLPGKPGVLPTLKGRAVHEVGEVTLVMLLSGPVSRPEVRLESIPPLPPQDLLSYLVFGRPARALTREEYLRVGPKAAGIVGGLTAQKLQEFLGKDFPLVGNVTLKAGADTVGVAKPLTKDLTISYERKTETGYREDVNQMRLEYRVNRYLSIESQLGRRNSGADVLFNLDW